MNLSLEGGVFIGENSEYHVMRVTEKTLDLENARFLNLRHRMEKSNL